jgi:hypothetical protein
MLLELDQEQLRVLRRALEARARDMHLRLGWTLRMKAFGAKQPLPHSFCVRSRPWKGVLVTAPGALVIVSPYPKTMRTEWKQTDRLSSLG